jgi:hypothetical protein
MSNWFRGPASSEIVSRRRFTGRSSPTQSQVSMRLPRVIRGLERYR